MRFLNYSVVCFCAVLLVGCAEFPPKAFPPPNDYVPISQVQITSRFNSVEVTRETLGLEVNKCVPQLAADSQGVREQLQKFPSNDSWGVGQASSANIFLLRKTTAVCLQKSSEKFSIFAAEAFFDTVNPHGVPPDVIDDWYKQIALFITAKGTAKIAYVFGNGNAFIVNYWIEKPLEFGMFYSSVNKKAGEWERENLDAKFSHPSMDSVSVTKRSGRSEKMDPLSHRQK
ncbi:MAG: hypothetical protein WC742_04785 [Gallionellaceae bacterium]|jgi:hypothetical protein